MRVSEQDLELFYKLHPALLLYANQELNITDCSTTEEVIEILPEEKIKIRDALYDRISLIDSFVQENPFNFSSDELDIVLGWKHLIRGTFIIRSVEQENQQVYLLDEFKLFKQPIKNIITDVSHPEEPLKTR